MKIKLTSTWVHTDERQFATKNIRNEGKVHVVSINDETNLIVFPDIMEELGHTPISNSTVDDVLSILGWSNIDHLELYIVNGVSVIRRGTVLDIVWTASGERMELPLATMSDPLGYYLDLEGKENVVA